MSLRDSLRKIQENKDKDINKDPNKDGKLSIFSRLLLHGGNASDASSTIYGLNHGAMEANPLFGSNPSSLKVALIKTGTSIGSDLLFSNMAKKHPKLANGLAKGMGIGLMAVAASNIHQTRKK